ncbi:MAG: SRPBCC family protein [Acidimicrobiales bacterium]|nr:SRPBCC family protein [Acidimicrobiales bacterium]
MAHYSTTVTTLWSPEEAFAYMADLRNFEEWDPGVSSAELVAGEAPGMHAEYDVKVAATTLRYKTLEFEPSTRVVIEATSSLLRSYDVIEVTPADEGGGAIVHYDATLELNGILRLADPLLRLAFDRIGDRAADGMRRVLASKARA